MDTQMLSNCFLIFQKETLISMQEVTLEGLHLCGLAYMNTQTLFKYFWSMQKPKKLEFQVHLTCLPLKLRSTTLQAPKNLKKLKFSLKSITKQMEPSKPEIKALLSIMHFTLIQFVLI